ncbi:hypothetical protein MCOR27_000962 [Pyricularia oryzae]|uniref:Uncharacterized protein n=2 Tax=Pyricularia TaxID=48558 RepID=A0ABQ8NZQ6_PYRGI|nr:hypothetical protein MCOR01_003455 [Pyricularia oryzae]KAI6304470.1 hypothetical protein MCOR33_000562 [Pyricularia grisea]KAH9432239.1 hypothetical protein MCOR02_006944 [Pyricularia oryzae]KAI6258188.1 hypothetical protein MCOR19_005435 [Pyricularia oryzae]KAI6281918.1 hypothetical protein MCOR26_003048 [Pyricularia oryzae]
MRFSITPIIATLALSINAMPAQSEPAAMVNRDVSSSELAQMMRDTQTSNLPPHPSRRRPVTWTGGTPAGTRAPSQDPARDARSAASSGAVEALAAAKDMLDAVA